MSDEIEGKFVDLRGRGDQRRNSYGPRDPARELLDWLRLHWRAVAIPSAVLVALLVLIQLELFGTAMVLAMWGWYALLGGSIAIGIARWLARSESRSQLREFVRASWRELILAGVLGLVVGEVSRADDLFATLFIGGFAFMMLLPAVGWFEDRTSFGLRYHSLAPRYFVIAALALLALGPQFRRELPTDMCDAPNYWEQTDYEESDSGQGHAVYSCYSPAIDDYVAPRVEGRSLFGLRMSNIGLRVYSLNFTDGHYEGVGICSTDEDCFP